MPPAVGADVVVLAGDVHVKNRGLQWIFDQKFEIPVLYVLGNHELYMDDYILEHQPHLWIHGHTHESFDYELGNTRMVCNPRGCASTEENKAFRPDYTVEI